jgi:hypothetical protein
MRGKLSIKFHPLLFQASLAAGGVALMAFNYLHFAIPHGKGPITLSDISWTTMTESQVALYVPLVAVMLAFTFLNFGLTGYFLYRMVKWLREPGAYSTFKNNAQGNANAGIFAIVGSLSMTVNVVWAPFGFFVPQMSSQMQAMMVPSLVVFGLLLAALLFLEVTFGRTWFAEGVDRTKFNFIWLLDAFAFGLVALTGSGIVATATNETVDGIAAVATLFTLAVGLLVLVYKVAYLTYNHVKAGSLPAHPIMPAFFLIIPISCLFGLSAYRMGGYLQPEVASGATGSPSALIVASYALAVVWGVGSLYLIRDYFISYFVKSPFAPPQWGFV